MDEASLSFPKESRLRKRKEFLRVYEQGRKIRGRYFFIYLLENGLGRNRLGLTVSKRTGVPVERNRVKRRLREIFRCRKERIQPFSDIVVNVRRGAVEAEYEELEKDFDRVVESWIGSETED